MDKVSIVIPCYNYGKFLSEAIESAQSQDYENIEIIVVNDGSTDDTIEVSNKYDVMLINTMHRSVSHARNTGISKASGKYIVCLDADDKLSHNYVSELLPLMEKYDIVGTWAQMFGDRNEILTYDKVTKVNHSMLRYKNFVHTSAMFKKKLFKKHGGFDEQLLKGYEDWDYWRRLALLGSTIYVLHKPLLFYRKHGNTRNDEAKKYNKELFEYINNKDKNHGIDVVIPMGTGSVNSNNELRFCLRSIEKNLRGYRNIWIVGFMPKWMRNLKHIPFKEYHPKANNIHDKIKAACQHPEVSDEFIMFNDDYFLTCETQATTYPYFYSRDAMIEVMERPKADPYRRLVVDTINETGMKEYFDIHCPMRIKKSVFLSMPYNRNYEGGILVKSSYAKHAVVQGTPTHDAIIRTKMTREQIENMEVFTDCISVHDEAINQDFISWVQDRYPHKCSYEV